MRRTCCFVLILVMFCASAASAEEEKAKFLSVDPETGVISPSGSIPMNQMPKHAPGVAVPWRKQQRLNDRKCGVGALFVFLRMNGAKVNLATLEAELKVGENGIDMLQLKECARRHGVNAKVVECSPADLAPVLPAIIRLAPGSESELAHYDVITRMSDDEIACVEPTSGRYETRPREYLTQYFTGHALVIAQQGSGWFARYATAILSCIAVVEVFAIADIAHRLHRVR